MASGTRSTAHALRSWLAWATVGCAAVLGLPVLQFSADARPTAETEDATTRGGELYQRWCAVCHASDGSGTASGPPIDDVSTAYMDLVMRTGYMPLTDPSRGVRTREFTDEERAAALAYMVERFELTGEVAEPGAGDAGRGQEVYTLHCTQCHGASGEGGVAGQDATVPRARGVAPTLIAQSVRVGQFQMPSFSQEQISDDELADLVTFLEDKPSSSPLGLADLTRIDAFAWAAVLTTVILAACWWIARPARPHAGPTGDEPGDEQGARK